MSAETDPVPPVPSTTPMLNDRTGTSDGEKKLIENNWNQWFLSLRTKINILNALMVSISKLTSTGFIAISGGVAATRELLTGPGVDVSNGTGATHPH